MKEEKEEAGLLVMMMGMKSWELRWVEKKMVKKKMVQQMVVKEVKGEVVDEVGLVAAVPSPGKACTL